jgi:hypothetical protein
MKTGLSGTIKDDLETSVSLDMTIPCPRAFRGVDLVVYAERALRDLLDLSTSPRLKVWHREGDQDVPLDLGADLGEGLPMMSIGLEGIPENVQLMYYRIEQAADWVPVEERGFRAGVAASEEEMAWGGSTRLALGAGVALALARLQNTMIIDHRLSLTHNERQTPDQFFKELCVKGPFDDFKKAADALFRRTPLNALNGVGLHVLEIERDVDGMIVEILSPIRLKGKVEWEPFQKFFGLVDEWFILASKDKGMATNLGGVLMLVDEFLLEEVRKTPAALDIAKAAADVEARRNKLDTLLAS